MFANGLDEGRRPIGSTEVGGKDHGTPCIFGVAEKSRQRAAFIPADMHQHARAAVEKLPRHLKPDPTARTRHDDGSVGKQIGLKH